MLLDLSEKVRLSKLSSTVGIADQVTRLREASQQVVDFSAGRATEDTPSYIVEAAVEAMKSGDTHQTMAKGTTLFRSACANKLERDNKIIADPEREIIATMGVKQGLTIALLSLLNPGDEVIVENPCFVSYHQLIAYSGGISVPVPIRPENQFRWDKAELEASITSKTKAILFNSPHNPTGVVHSREDLQLIADVAIKYNLYVITDEVYERMIWDGNTHLNLASLPGMRERTITVMGLTKSFAMGGWRVGFIYASPTIISYMEKLQQHLITSCNAFVQAGAAVAFGEPPRAEVTSYWQEWQEKCRFATQTLNETPGLSTSMPQGAFYAWTDISALGIPSEVFCKRLLEEMGVAVIPGVSFGSIGEGHIRITCVKSWQEMEDGIFRIKTFVEKL
ncbi:MAG: aminotransferase class I/II-fold pyridoxal phosphate-dependent enzyme [Saprospiraceae bacterium]|nr:aminotransferase class I/II-fold pyridoxal phosphate-dependent enzyme [Saprospiraceae bacterium]